MESRTRLHARAGRIVLGLCAVAVAVAVATAIYGLGLRQGCDGGACGVPPGGRTVPDAMSFEEFAVHHCAALQSLFRAYGNPDTAGLSPLMQTFDDAIDRADVVGATARSVEIVAELETGRARARAAGAWPPATAAMAQLDRLLAAMERLVTARLAAIGQGSDASEREGQAALEAAGGVEAWFGWIEAVGALLEAEGRRLPPCEGVPIS